MQAKFACANLAAKVSVVNLLNSGVVIYLSCSCSYIIFVLQSVLITKLLTLGILFSAAVRAVVIARLVILGILILTSIILALSIVLVAKLVTSRILS